MWNCFTTVFLHSISIMFGWILYIEIKCRYFHWIFITYSTSRAYETLFFLSKSQLKCRTFHVPNLKKEFSSLTLGPAHEKFDVWPRLKTSLLFASFCNLHIRNDTNVTFSPWLIAFLTLYIYILTAFSLIVLLYVYAIYYRVLFFMSLSVESSFYIFCFRYFSCFDQLVKNSFWLFWRVSEATYSRQAHVGENCKTSKARSMVDSVIIWGINVLESI